MLFNLTIVSLVVFCMWVRKLNTNMTHTSIQNNHSSGCKQSRQSMMLCSMFVLRSYNSWVMEQLNKTEYRSHPSMLGIIIMPPHSTITAHLDMRLLEQHRVIFPWSNGPLCSWQYSQKMENLIKRAVFVYSKQREKVMDEVMRETILG